MTHSMISGFRVLIVGAFALLLCTAIAVRAEGREDVAPLTDPWPDMAPVPVQWSIYRSETAPLVILEPAESAVWAADGPVLVFFEGWLPFYGIRSYANLIVRLAQRGVTVVVPLYLGDAHRNPDQQLVDAVETATKGISSNAKTEGVLEVLHEFFDDRQWETRPKVAFGHSMGTRVLTGIAERSALFSAVILAGVAPKQVTGVNGKEAVIDQDSRCIDNDAADGPSRLGDRKLTILHYEGDRIFEGTVPTAFDGCLTTFRQILFIHDLVRDGRVVAAADHFAPMSNDVHTRWRELFRQTMLIPGDNWTKETFLRYVVTKTIPGLHGYELNIADNEVDEYGALEPLTALAWNETRPLAGMDELNTQVRQPIRDWAHYTLYGEGRTLDLAGGDRPVRTVNAEIRLPR